MATAPTSLIKDRPDGQAAAMGACYSSSKGKPSSSASAATSTPQRKPATQMQNSNPPASPSGKARRSHQSFCSNSSQKALPKDSGQEWSTSFGSTHTQMKSPNLKSGVGAYEVLTPRKQTSGIHDMPPTKLNNSPRKTATVIGLKIDAIGVGNGAGMKVTESPSKAESLPLVPKGPGVKELCKNCKTGNSESVCYIANDGRIAATNAGPATVRHFHHCNSPKCAANPNYQPPSSLPSKKVLSVKPSVSCSRSEKAKMKSDKLHVAHDSETCSSTNSSILEGGTGCNQNCKEEGLVQTLSSESRPDFEGKTLDAADVCGTSVASHGFFSENVQEGSTTSPQSCPCAKDDQRCGSPMHANEQTVPGSMLPLHCVDDDFSCGNDVSDIQLTTKDPACKDFDSNAVLAELDAAIVLQARKSSMERMRQRYLDCLKEQEAETVRLKKQEMISRKQAGEWMLDSAIGEILQKLAPDGEAGVKVIVEAFETVMQQSDLDSHNDNATSMDSHHDNATSIDC